MKVTNPYHIVRFGKDFFRKRPTSPRLLVVDVLL